MKKRLLCCMIIAVFICPVISFAQPMPEVVARKNAKVTTLETAQGKWSFSLFSNHVLKTTFRATGSSRNEQVSDAVLGSPVAELPTINIQGSYAIISWKDGTRVHWENNSIRFVLNNKAGIYLQNGFCNDSARGFFFDMEQNEKLFGTGERSLPLNRAGYRLNLNNNPWYGYELNADALNFSVPVLLSSRKYALFFDNPSKGFLDLGKTLPGTLQYSVMSGELSFYLVPGVNTEEILTNYQQLVGTQPLPPRWAMGNFMSRFGYRYENQVNSIFQAMKKEKVPFDAVIFDLFWFGDSIKKTMGNLDWVNRKAWPDPKKMIAGFQKQQVKTILITEPFVLKTSGNYDNAKPYLATDSMGKPFELKDFYFGEGGIIDIFLKDAQDWFFNQYKKQVSIGVSGWWGDLGEPEKHPTAIYHDLSALGFNRKFSADEVHNIYGHYWSRMLFNNYRKYYPKERLFHLNRSGYAGSPRFCSFPWSGDVSRSWAGLKAQLPLIQGMALSAIPYIHSDAGGFAGGDGDAELYIRWLQFAVFTPIYRPHGTALGDLEPTVKDIPSEAALWPEPTLSLARSAAKERYQWLPYNYNLSYLQTLSGKPLIKPLFFLNETDSNLYKAEDQYLWGDKVMIVPITNKSEKIKTYFIPEGKWTNIYDYRVFEGPKWVTDSNITINQIPVYAMEGSFIPQATGITTTADYDKASFSVLFFPSAKPGEYHWYEDDGTDPAAIKNKNYRITHFSATPKYNGTEIVITREGNYNINVPREIMLVIPAQGIPKGVRMNNKLIKTDRLFAGNFLRIPVLLNKASTEIFISW